MKFTALFGFHIKDNKMKITKLKNRIIKEAIVEATYRLIGSEIRAKNNQESYRINERIMNQWNLYSCTQTYYILDVTSYIILYSFDQQKQQKSPFKTDFKYTQNVSERTLKYLYTACLFKRKSNGH